MGTSRKLLIAKKGQKLYKTGNAMVVQKDTLFQYIYSGINMEVKIVYLAKFMYYIWRNGG